MVQASNHPRADRICTPRHEQWGATVSFPKVGVNSLSGMARQSIRHKHGNTMNTRIERDTFGPIEVPADRLWGAQTQRSLINFDISGERMPPELIRALAQIKRSSAVVNNLLGLLPQDKAAAIIAAADEVIAGLHAEEFPLVVWQTGSGTQTN